MNRKDSPEHELPCSLLRDESGQAATEYAVLAFWTAVIILVAAQALELALLDFFQDVATLICLPIP